MKGPAQKGVVEAELIAAAWDRGALVVAYIGILLLASMTSLESQVNFLFIPYITSDFSAHGLLSTIQIISAVLQAVLKAPAAKVADVFGRTEALCLGLLFYALGYICMAVSSNIWWYAASQIFYIGGNTGLQFLIQVIVADTSSTINRALLSALAVAPFLWTVWAGPPLGEKLLNTLGWRWGTALWIVLVPISAIPLMAVLLRSKLRLKSQSANRHYDEEEAEAMYESLTTPTSAQYTPRHLKESAAQGNDSERRFLELALSTQESRVPDNNELVDETKPGDKKTADEKKSDVNIWRRLIVYGDQMDIIGTLIISAGLTLLLVPLTVASRDAKNGASPRAIVPMIVGALMCGGFIWYELKVAHFPLVSLRMLRTPTIFLACGAGFFYFFSYYVGRVYFTSYLQVAAFCTPSGAGYINNAMNFSSVTSGILAGVLIKYTGRLRPFIWVGTVLYLVGLSLLIFVRRPENGIGWMILSQIILGIGGGFFGTPNQTLVQSHASHQDLSAATALVLIITILGWSTGAAVAGAIWTERLPARLKANLPIEFLPVVDQIADDMTYAMSFERDSPARTAINMSYYEVMRLLCIIGAGLGGLQLICTLLCKSANLKAHGQKATEDCQPDASRVETPAADGDTAAGMIIYKQRQDDKSVIVSDRDVKLSVKPDNRLLRALT